MTTVVSLERVDLRASLSSWIMTSMTMLHECVGIPDFRARVSWPEHRSPAAYHDQAAFARNPNMWEWFFLQPATPVRGEHSQLTWVYEAIWGGPLPPSRNLHTFDHDSVGRFYKTHLQFADSVVNRAQDLATEYSLAPSNAIAVSWRGTDKWTEAAVSPIASYFPVLDRLIEEEPDLRIFVKAEEAGAQESILERYPQAFAMTEFFTANAGETRMMDWVSPLSGLERGMQAVLLIYLFSRCKYLVKNNANLSSVAEHLSNGTVITVPPA